MSLSERSASEAVRGGTPRTAGEAVRGVSKAALDALIKNHGDGAIPAQMRYDALARFEELPARQVIRGGRSWKHDLAKVDLTEVTVFDDFPDVFASDRVRNPEIFAEAFGKAVDTGDDKFASLALAFQSLGHFIAIPAGRREENVVVRYGPHASFPYTLIYVAEGASATVTEQFFDVEFSCGITEIVLEERASLAYVVNQRAAASGRTIFTRRARLGKDAHLSLAIAALGAEHSVERIRVTADGTGSNAELTGFFFANGDQHVDLETEVVHAAGATHSETLVRSAGTGRGQGRYLGNIKILKAAHGADATLRDDALLLSKEAHVDSIPALEIAANDVKAYHGATVGAISEDEIFYAQTRGLSRPDAERMIALGFFEPALARFPGEALRGELRAALEAKLDLPAVTV